MRSPIDVEIAPSGPWRDVLARVGRQVGVPVVIAIGALTALTVAVGSWIGRGDEAGIGAADLAAVRGLAGARTPTIDTLTGVGAVLADVVPVTVLWVAAIVVAAVVTRRWVVPVFLLAAIGGEKLTYLVASSVVGRPRPPVEPLGHVFATSSFPSGHVGSAVTLYGGIAVAVLWYRRTSRGHRVRPAARVALGIAVAATAVVVAISRVWRGHHHPSDVVWGAVLGLTWLVLAWWLVLRRVERAEPSARSGSTSVPVGYGPSVDSSGGAGVGRIDERRAACPKRMVYGPCGGVRSGGRCEVDDRPCPFVTSAAPAWPAVRGDEPRRRPVAGTDLAPPIVVCDIRPAEPTLMAARTLARAHAGWCDAVLLGEHHDRIDLPNVVLAPALLDEGCRPWVTLTCRDRNGVALESELAALAEVGVREVHCVTGDARAAHVRPGTTPVFDLDSLRLTALARSLGLTVSVAESPTVEPVDRRPSRAADKARAGATWCFVNLGVSPGEVDRFIERSRHEGSTLRHIVCVPVFTDAAGADRLAALPGVELDPSVVDAVVHAPDPRSAGIAHAVAAARTFLAVDGVDGVNLSGPASSVGPADRAEVMRAVAEQIRVPPGPGATGREADREGAAVGGAALMGRG